MSLIPTRLGNLEESLLIKRQDKIVSGSPDEAYYAIATSTEYCEANCPGQAHQTGKRDAESFFCKEHVRRDVHVDVLKMVGMAPQLFSAADIPQDTSNL